MPGDGGIGHAGPAGTEGFARPWPPVPTRVRLPMAGVSDVILILCAAACMVIGHQGYLHHLSPGIQFALLAVIPASIILVLLVLRTALRRPLRGTVLLACTAAVAALAIYRPAGAAYLTWRIEDPAPAANRDLGQRILGIAYRFPDRRATHALLDILRDPRIANPVKWNAAIALGFIGDETASTELTAILEATRERRTRIRIASALVMLGRDFLPEITRFLQTPYFRRHSTDTFETAPIGLIAANALALLEVSCPHRNLIDRSRAQIEDAVLAENTPDDVLKWSLYAILVSPGFDDARRRTLFLRHPAQSRIVLEDARADPPAIWRVTDLDPPGRMMSRVRLHLKALAEDGGRATEVKHP